MSKSKNNYNSMSVWGLLLVGLSLVLILVSVFRYFTAGISFGREGFQQKERLVLKEGSDVYDDFYVDIYDQLVFNELKNHYEVGEIIQATKPTTESKILDIGSGTGHHVSLFSKGGFDATGVDISQFMIDKAKKLYPDEKYIKGDVKDAALFSPNSFTHITCLYFGIYYFKDKLAFFNNCNKWLTPGGYLVVHIVDRDNFDPILPPANPLIVVSPQKYASKRITNSKIRFNNMTYEANFDMKPNSDVAVFSEKFEEPAEKKMRKNKHVFVMESDKTIVTIAKQAGFIMQGKIDLLNVGYEYQYLYIFMKPT